MSRSIKKIEDEFESSNNFMLQPSKDRLEAITKVKCAEIIADAIKELKKEEE